MNVKWLIEESAIPDDVAPLVEALKQQNLQYKVIKSKPFLDNHFDNLYEPNDCVVFMGSLNLAKLLIKKAKWIPGVYYNVTKYNCVNYYPLIGDLLLNCNYIMLPFGELKRRKEYLYEHLSSARTIFLRPNRGDKLFNAEVIYKEEFDKKIDYFGYGNINDDELVIAAEPINIEKEWRFVCINGSIITGSLYKENNIVGSEVGYPIEAFDFANHIASLYQPDKVWIIDICLTKSGRYAVMEIGCFSCAGLYKCDRNIIVKEVSKIAIEEWQSYQI